MDICRPPGSGLPYICGPVVQSFGLFVAFNSWIKVYSCGPSDSGDQDHISGLQFPRFQTICTRRPSVHSFGLFLLFHRKGTAVLDLRTICMPAVLDFRTIYRPATLNFRTICRPVSGFWTICRPAALDFRTICRPTSRFWAICRPANTRSSLHSRNFGLIVPG
jgi:hypothetical protein